MAKSLTDKLEQKRRALVERTALILGVNETEAIRLLSIGRVQSLRINRLKADDAVLDKLRSLGWCGEQFDWYADGYTIESGLQAIRDSQLVAEGSVYIQNAASWLPVLALDPQPAEHILDLCAAPGGKTSHIAQLVHNEAHITANDNSRPRLAKLRSNLTRLGVQNVEYTLFDATQVARKLDGRYFDKILLDAPCSGEGMMKYASDKDFATWSVAHIKRLQQLQKRLITQAWQLLKPGGTLVYSTCTMAPEENEAVVDYLLRKQNDAAVAPLELHCGNGVSPVVQWGDRHYDPCLVATVRLIPSQNAEAFFVAKIGKLQRAFD